MLAVSNAYHFAINEDESILYVAVESATPIPQLVVV